jgi:type IV secretory pathway VirB2 component (pilin)
MTTEQACCSSAIRDEVLAALAKVSAEAGGPIARCWAVAGVIASGVKIATAKTAKDKLFIADLQRSHG